MLKVFKNIEQYDTTKGKFFNWVYTVVRNAALTEVRNKKIEATILYTDVVAEVAFFNPFEEKEWETVYEMLQQLPATTRAVCVLFYIEGFTIKETADSLEMKPGTVKWHLNEGRNRLKNTFTPNFCKSEG